MTMLISAVLRGMFADLFSGLTSASVAFLNVGAAMDTPTHISRLDYSANHSHCPSTFRHAVTSSFASLLSRLRPVMEKLMGSIP